MAKFKGVIAKQRNEKQLFYVDDDIVIIGDPKWENANLKSVDFLIYSNIDGSKKVRYEIKDIVEKSGNHFNVELKHIKSNTSSGKDVKLKLFKNIDFNSSNHLTFEILVYGIHKEYRPLHEPHSKGDSDLTGV